MTIKQLWIYAIGDDSTPGSYTNIDGYSLCDEGSDRVSSIEAFRASAKDLRENCEWDCHFALVEETEDGEKTVVEVA